jgi:hypothetical protein
MTARPGGTVRPATRGGGRPGVEVALARPPTREHLGAAGALRSYEQRLSSPSRLSYRPNAAAGEGSSRAMGRAKAFLDKIQQDERASPETVRKEPRRQLGLRERSALLSPCEALRGAQLPGRKSMQNSAKYILGNVSPTHTSERPRSRCQTPASPVSKSARTNSRLTGFLEEGVATPLKESTCTHAPPAAVRQNAHVSHFAVGQAEPEGRGGKRNVYVEKKSTEEMKAEMMQIFHEAKV